MATLEEMDLAAKQDRKLLFDMVEQLRANPMWVTYLHDVDMVEAEWKAMEKIEGYPQIDWPLEVPDFFPPIFFRNHWRKEDQPWQIVISPEPPFQEDPPEARKPPERPSQRERKLGPRPQPMRPPRGGPNPFVPSSRVVVAPGAYQLAEGSYSRFRRK